MPAGVKKCTFFGCENDSLFLPMFGYPVKRKEICKQWVNNSGFKALLFLSDWELKDRRVCCAHFDSACIKFDGYRHVLEQYAVPRSWDARHSPEYIRVKFSRRFYPIRRRKNLFPEESSNNNSPTSPKCKKKEHAPPAIMEGTLLDTEFSTGRDHTTGTDFIHEGFKCDHCHAGVMGFRYTCVQCADYDLCSACETRREHPHHYVLRIPAPTPHDEIQMVLQTIRRALLNDSIVHVAGTDCCFLSAQEKF